MSDMVQSTFLKCLLHEKVITEEGAHKMYESLCDEQKKSSNSALEALFIRSSMCRWGF